MTIGLPSPSVVAVKEERLTKEWYNYLFAADRTWRPVATVASSNGTLISNGGITEIRTTAGTTHILASPEPGVRKVLVASAATGNVRVNASSTTTTIKPGSGWALTFNSTYETIELIGLSTSSWLIVSNPGGVTVST